MDLMTPDKEIQVLEPQRSPLAFFSRHRGMRLASRTLGGRALRAFSDGLTGDVGGGLKGSTGHLVTHHWPFLAPRPSRGPGSPRRQQPMRSVGCQIPGLSSEGRAAFISGWFRPR